MTEKSKMDALRQAVLGNKRGREAEVSPDGQVVLNTGDDQDAGNSSDQVKHVEKVSKMSQHTFGR